MTMTLDNLAENAFDWCEINGEIEAYCMATLCANCPANKEGRHYNPESSLVTTYKKIKGEKK